MDIKEYSVLSLEQEKKHWYFNSKYAALKKDISRVTSFNGKKIVDIGAGSAYFSKRFLEDTNLTEATCIDIAYSTEYSEYIYGKKIEFKRKISKLDAEIILMIDVLEHVDDFNFMKYYCSLAKKDSVFVISVPAFQFLWSGHDVFVSHKRRYTLNSLGNFISTFDFRIELLHYYYGLTFPIAAFMRIGEKIMRMGKPPEPLSQLKKHSDFVNNILSSLCKAELPLMHYNKLAGISVFCICTKQ